MVPSGILRRVALVRTDVSEELSASFNRITGIGEIGTPLASTSNRRSIVYQPWMVDGDNCGASDGMNYVTGKPKNWKKSCASIDLSN
jgi:hypothetical protein